MALHHPQGRGPFGRWGVDQPRAHPPQTTAGTVDPALLRTLPDRMAAANPALYGQLSRLPEHQLRTGGLCQCGRFAVSFQTQKLWLFTLFDALMEFLVH